MLKRASAGTLSSGGGFTMVEIMVVIAVIAVLALMAVPSYQEKIVSNFVSSVLIQGGAIHVTFGNRANSAIRGKVLTLRPAVVADAPIVPVAWVCGNATAPDKMTLKGENKTTIPAIFLPLKCRP